MVISMLMSARRSLRQREVQRCTTYRKQERGSSGTVRVLFAGHRLFVLVSALHRDFNLSWEKNEAF